MANAIISFTGIGHQLGGIQTEEFKKIKNLKDYDHMFFIDKNRSWMNNVNLDSVINFAKKYDKVITLGNSMGAFSAATFAEYTTVNVAICFATQYSIHPDIIPWDNRWIDYSNNIKTWKHKHLSLNNFTKYYFIGGDDLDKKHIDMIPDKSNVTKIIIEGTGHDVAKKLKAKNKLYPLIEDILDKEITNEL